MADLPERYKDYYLSLQKQYPDMKIDFTRNECCEDNSKHRYSIPDWYGGGHYFFEECTKCGKEWCADEHEIFELDKVNWDDDEEE